MTVNPSLRIWKEINPQPGYPNWWPLYRSADVFVDNDGNRSIAYDGTFKYYWNVDEIGEPTKGIATNRLFAVIRNLGSTAANAVRVVFSYSPYGGVGIFKQIGDPVVVNLGPAGSPDAEKEIEIQWDLSDLTETNDGKWYAPIACFSHFCVQVLIASVGDIDLQNNWTQNNFSNVMSASPFPPELVIVANPDKEAKNFELIAPQLPKNVTLRIRGMEKFRAPYSTAMWKTPAENTRPVAATVKEAVLKEEKTNILLGAQTIQPMAAQLATVRAIPIEGQQEDKPFLEISIKTGDKIVGGFTFALAKEKAPAGLLPRERPKYVPRYIKLPSNLVNATRKR